LCRCTTVGESSIHADGVGSCTEQVDLIVVVVIVVDDGATKVQRGQVGDLSIQRDGGKGEQRRYDDDVLKSKKEKKKKKKKGKFFPFLLAWLTFSSRCSRGRKHMRLTRSNADQWCWTLC
jgi:hypothetical protein